MLAWSEVDHGFMQPADLFQWASSKKIQLSRWVQYKADIIISWKIAHLTLNNNRSLIHCNLILIDSYLSHGPSWSWSYGKWIFNYLPNQCLSPLKLWVRILFVVRCTRYNIIWEIYQWLLTDQWFSLGTPVSSTNKSDCHDITEILLKVVLNIINHI
jgi:hypothetical protein